MSNAQRLPFSRFYREVFLAEHTHPANIALHVLGTLASLAFVPLVIVYFSLWWLLLYPVIHALPGLLGHRLFERNASVGDVRVMRKDYPGVWFIAGNHLLTLMLFTGTLRRGRASEGGGA
jgi:hypothetical protein